MTRHVPRRLTGAALLLALALTLSLVPAAPAWATERFEARAEPAAEQPVEARNEEGFVAWLWDTWNQLHTVFTGAMRGGGGEGPHGGDRGSGMDPNGHDHQAFQK